MQRRYSWPMVAALVLAAAGSSVAQQVSCGGIGMGAAWMGGDAAASDIAGAAAPLTLGGINVPQAGMAVGLFSVGVAMDVRVEARPQGQGDTVLELYDAAGGLILVDDDSGGDLASRAELRLEPGTYCLAARGFADAAVTADLQVSRLDMPALTIGLAGGFAGTESLPLFVGIQPCLAATPAQNLGSGALDAQLPSGVRARNTTAAVPYYRFTLNSAQPVSIRAESPVADPYIYLFDNQGVLLGENDDSDGLNSRLDFLNPPLPAGTYCIGMRSLSDANVPVTLSMLALDQASVQAEAYANAQQAPVNGGYPVHDLGEVETVAIIDRQVLGGQAVFFSFDVTQPALMSLTADEITDSDPWIRLFDARGNLIDENDDANASLNSEVIRRLPPGRYFLGVRQYDAAYAGTIRVMLQRYVPAR